ncbi:biotin attachment protein [Myroides sp. 1354]|uniref:biotin attachment protein n=1 Tax=unclassified Myroides TaxID=2642485 RepID=UPI002577A1AC|nr:MULTISPECIES: biotin attachment protein [unclassified Myroides]MDM1045643.1 biotin attachment protein [Myroides sp. R163-1]MDM1056645.1 biotin attachment protein [Myroides sp. 1354]MDM1069773.1 biotin attachment protein [Myroides sp. 1372]
MKNTKVRAQQIIMTVGCIVFLVWVGIRGMNERASDTQETSTKVDEQLPLASGGVHLVDVSEEVVVVNQAYPTQVGASPSIAIRADRGGELLQLKVDVNDRIEIGQEIAFLRVAQGDTLGLGKVNRKVREAKIHVKEELERLLAIDRGEDGSEAKEKYEKQYALYNTAKKEAAEYEEQLNKIASSSNVIYVEKPIKATSEGIVKQILVGAGRTIEVNQPLLMIQQGQAKTIQIAVSSENYLLVRNHLRQIRAKVVFQDQSSLQLPASVLESFTQQSINEDGKIVMSLNVSSIPNVQDIRRLDLSILNIPTKVVDEKALFMRDTTSYIWTVNADKKVEATPVVVVKKEDGKAYVQKGNASWNRVLIGDLTTVKEGDIVE